MMNILKYPPGRIPSLEIRQSNITIDLTNTIIEPIYPNYQPLIIGSTVEPLEIMGEGLIGPTTNYLFCNSPNINRGDLLVIKAGVNTSDPYEAETTFFMKVIDKIDDMLVFDKYFDRAIKVYSSYDELISKTKYVDRVGPWKHIGSAYQRGLGLTHGLKKIVSPVENVTIINPTIVWPSKSRLYGAWAASLHFCRNINIYNMTVRNPCGSSIHFNWADNCNIDGLKVSGIGRSAPYGPDTQLNSTTSSPIISSWGAINCSVRRADIDGDNLSLINLEAGSHNLLFDDIMLKSTKPLNQRMDPQFGKYGPGQVTISNLSLDLPVSPSIIFPAGLTDTIIENLSIKGSVVPDWFSWGRGNYTGKFRLGDREFGPPEDIEFSFRANKDGFEIPYPQGIVMGAQIVLESRDGIRNITTPNECFLNQSGLILDVDPTSYTLKINNSYEDYRNQLRFHRIWMKQYSSSNIRVRAKIMTMRT